MTGTPDSFTKPLLKEPGKHDHSLPEPDGSYATTQNQLAQCANNYFKDIFASNSNCRREGAAWSSQTEPIQPIEDNSFTDSTPDLHEIQSIINSMRSNAAPGPDGLNAGFYKASWEWIGYS